MEAVKFLDERLDGIVARASDTIRRSHMEHYDNNPPNEVANRMKKMCEVLIDGLREKSSMPMARYAGRLARERFRSGFQLQEIQTAFNAIEEAVWHQILRGLRPTQFAETAGMVGAILGIGKDIVARAYVSFATDPTRPTVDVAVLFGGTEGERIEPASA